MISQLKTILRSPSFWLLTLALLVVYIPIYYAVGDTTDYVEHAKFAKQIYEQGLGTVSHFLYHLMYLAIYIPFPNLNSAIISVIPLIFASVVVGWTIYILLTIWFEDILPTWSRQIITLSLGIISPVFVWFNMPFFMGYINFNAFHNPTQNILKLFVIPISLIAMRAIYPQSYASNKQRIGFITLSAVLMVLMIISKPNYIIVLLPTLVLYALYRLIKRQNIDFPLLIFGIMLPALIVLGGQYFLTYNASDDAGIAMGLAIILRIRIDPTLIILKLLLSILFPLSVYLLHFQQAKQDRYLNFSWTTFLIGLVYSYLFHETGSRMLHGNFLWSAYITLFVLMFASVVFLLKTYRPLFERWHQSGFSLNIPPRLLIVILVFSLHVASGIRYYVAFIN